MLRSRSRGTTQHRDDADPLHARQRPAGPRRPQPAPRRARPADAPGDPRPGQHGGRPALRQGLLLGQGPRGGPDPTAARSPTTWTKNWAGITAEETIALSERARELGAVRLVSVEDGQRTDQGDTDHAVAAFLCELGEDPLAVELGLDLQERTVSAEDDQQTGRSSNTSTNTCSSAA